MMKKLLLSLTLAAGVAGMANAQSVEMKTATCTACHGGEGVSMVPNWPNLAGQGSNYLYKQIIDIRDGRRDIPEMVGMVDHFTDEDVREIANFYASKPANLGQTDPALAEKGRNLYRAGDMAKGIPARTACHLPNGGGNKPAAFPAVSGQHPTYTVNQLTAFRAGERTNDPNSMMRLIAEKMSDAEMEAVASYMYGLHGTNR